MKCQSLKIHWCLGVSKKIPGFSKNQDTKTDLVKTRYQNCLQRIAFLLGSQADTFPSLGTELITVFTRTCNFGERTEQVRWRKTGLVPTVDGSQIRANHLSDDDYPDYL